ncbi:methyltransferase [Sphaerisporangium sp. NPDC049003]|uniref:methyltransferase n=1 Tax=Sphaerisporangium sp. NPDC049003 TaxID=3364517 RepID=UPI0037215893
MTNVQQRVAGLSLPVTPPSAGAGSADVILQITGWPEKFAALVAFTQLRLPDHLADGPLTLQELEQRVGAHPHLLARVLRVLEPLGMVVQIAAQTYELGSNGQTLRADVAGSMRDMVLAAAEWREPLSRLTEIVLTGRPEPFVGRKEAEGVAALPRRGRGLAGDRADAARLLASHIANMFTGEGTLMDVSGGSGIILAEVVARNPGWRGVLLERPDLLPQAKTYLAEHGVLDLCRLVEGDVIASVPAIADTYLLFGVLHEYPDSQAEKILANVRAAMGPATRLICVDMLLPPGGSDPHPGLSWDMRTLVSTDGGRERTGEEYLGLLERGLGFAASPKVIPLPLGLSLVVSEAPA